MRISYTQAADINTLRKNLPWPWCNVWHSFITRLSTADKTPGHDAVDMRISHTQAADKNTLRKNLPWPWQQL
jgi:hypothetical protein